MLRLSLIVGTVVGLLLLGEILNAQSIHTSVYPSAVDTSTNATPFAVFVVISDWEELASEWANLRITRVGSGSHFRIWNDSLWMSASLYSNCPLVPLDSTGRWAGWMYLKAEGVSSTDFKAYARKADTTSPQIEEEESHSITLLDESTSGGWLEGHIYVDSLFTTGLEGIAVLALDSEQRLAGVYLTESNSVDEGYSDEPGYFRISSPTGVVESLEFRNLENDPVQGYTISTPPWVITGGSTRSIDDSSACALVSIRDTFGMVTDTLSIPIDIDTTTGLEICAVEISLSFNGEVIGFIGPDTSNTLVGDAGWLIEYNLVDDTLHLALAGSSNLSGSGQLINLIFSIDEEAAIGSSTSIHFENLLFNESGIGPDGYGQDGSLTVVSRWGDVSGDGEVHAYDAALLLKWIVDPAGAPLLPHQLIVADADLDGEITAYDGSLILQYVVGSIDELPYPGLKLTSATLRIENFQGYPGETTSVPIYLERPHNLFSVEAAICYDPKVLKLLNVTGTLSGQLFSHKQEEGKVKFVFAGSESATEDSRLALLTFLVLPNAKEGCTLSLQEVRMNNLPIQSETGKVKFSLLTSRESPEKIYLNQNCPNPFTNETIISFGIKKRCQVALKVYNISGELVKVLQNASYDPGYYSCSWDGKDEVGRQLGNGIYFCRMETEKYSLTRKMGLIR